MSWPVNRPPEIRVALLDRDGVINRKAPEGSYIRHCAELELLPGAAEAIQLLNRRGILAIVITNQRGIALAQMTETDLQAIHSALRAELAERGAHLDEIYHCPHDYGQCNCRKPQTGMLESAFRDFPVATRENTILIGDSAHDMEAGKNFGIRTILISSGQDESAGRAVPAASAPSLLAAVREIIG